MTQLCDSFIANRSNYSNEQPNGNTVDLHQQHFNFIIENHTIQFVNVQDPEECFRHCTKHFDYVAFKSFGKYVRFWTPIESLEIK